MLQGSVGKFLDGNMGVDENGFHSRAVWTGVPLTYVYPNGILLCST